MQQSVKNVCAKFKVDPLSRFRTGARQVFTTQKLFNTFKNHPLNIFSDQSIICQISFEIFDVKQVDTRAKKLMFELRQGISLFSFHFSIEMK